MNWIKTVPEESGYYFLKEYGDEYIVEIIMTREGPKFLEFLTPEIHDCYDFHDAEWLGPIKSEDIINLWKSFNEDKKK